MSRRSHKTAHGLVLGLLLVGLPLVGCSGDDGSPGASTGTLTGTVTNSANGGTPVANATITTTPAVSGVTITTNASGVYSAQLPVGAYELEVSATNFESETSAASILAAVTTTQDYALAPVSNVVIEITGAPGSATPGQQFQLTATPTAMDGSTVQSYSWTQTHSAQATITGGDTATPSITLGDAAAYKAALIDELTTLDERFVVVGVDPLAFERAGMVAFECEVTTTSGTYHEEVEVHTTLDFATWSTGLRNVPIGQPVLLSGADQATYDWQLTNAPGGATAALMDGTTRYPYFTPDLKGNYTVTVTDLAAAATVTLQIYAGEWWGGINGKNSEGRPTTLCASACHATIHNDKFVDWMNTGHAEILTNNINTGGHYGPSCFPCHTVGYGTGGIDSTTGYQAMLDALFPGGQSHPDPNNWDTMLANHPDQAAYCNIQCDNCHGPSGDGGAHANAMATDARISYGAQVCGTCHGEPPRHARYQQWQESGHGNYALAIEEGSRGSCGKCHTAQGFVEWSKMAIPFDVNTNPSNLGDGVAEPQTCVTCHDPHNVGTISGNNNDVTLRVEGDSPELLGGYTAYGIGKGATCIVCHNTRRGEADEVITSTPDRAPHGGAQGDVLMGFNAFFVTNGIRYPHSLITDTCANCHVARTPPPADLSYNLSGTNHTFAANTSICADCHGGFDPASLIAGADRRLEAFAEMVDTAIEDEIAFHIAAGREVTVSGEDASGNPVGPVTITSTSTYAVTHFGDSHGRQAMDITVDGVDVLHCQMDGGTEVLVGGNPDGTLWDNTHTDNAGQILRRVGWNYNLLHADGSHSLHNPGWWQQIVVASEAQLASIRP